MIPWCTPDQRLSHRLKRSITWNISSISSRSACRKKLSISSLTSYILPKSNK
uniref:Uncharacterized protein n=1 Tax=Arundo donax TaxID=35708 RepID=A0A0A9G171_ARUDO